MNFHLEHHIAELLYRSIRGKLSDFEREELNQWRSDSPMHEALFMRLQDDGYIDEELGIFVKGEEKNSILMSLFMKHQSNNLSTSGKFGGY